MTPEAFRAMAVTLPGASEGAHMDHADFRVGGRVFATLGHPDAGHAMVKLPPEEQAMRVDAAPEAFRPAAGAWGRTGSTLVTLSATDKTMAAGALACAHAAAARSKPPRSR